MTIKQAIIFMFNIGKIIKLKAFRSKFARIGVHSIVSADSVLVPQNMYIDDYVIIQNHLNFISNTGRLFVGSYSVISANCIIIPGRHNLKVGMPFYVNARYHLCDEDKDVVIKEDCWIGAGSILLPGITIGRGAVIGAGSVVTKNVPPYAVVAGSPAKIIAVRLTKDDVLKHESKIYDKENRITIEDVESLFDNYDNLNAISNNKMMEEECCKLNEILSCISNNE